MSIATGAKSRLVIDFEDTFGQDPSVATGYNMPFNSADIAATQGLTAPATLTGNRFTAAPIRGNIDTSGKLTVPVDGRYIGLWLKAVFGAPVTTGVGPYTHTYKPLPSIPSLVVEKGFTDIGQYFKYNGVKVNSFSISVGGDGELTADIDLVGKSESLSQVEYDSSLNTLDFSRLNNFQVSIKEGGSTLSSVTECSLTIENGLDDSIYTIGSGGYRGQIPEGQVNVSGTLTALFENSALITKAIDGTETSLEIEIDDGTNSLTFSIPELIFERTSPGISGPAGILLTLNFRGYFDNNADATNVKAVLINDIASY